MGYGQGEEIFSSVVGTTERRWANGIEGDSVVIDAMSS